MIPQIKELNFPEYATLSQATVTLNDMGERTISAQVKIDGEIKPDFSYDWEIEFKGEKYIHPLRLPQATKDNNSMYSKIDLTFYHWLIYELKRNYFVQLAPVESGTAIVDKYIASLNLNLTDFIKAFQDVLDYYYKGVIKIDLNPDVQYSKNVAYFSISYSYIWDVLQKLYEIYKVRWTIEGKTIKVGYPAPDVSHIFEYGYESGLMSIERQVQNAEIRNSLLGRGGSKNLPKYYFKNAPKGSLYASDPDAIPELENIYFPELRGKTFRDYVKGWKAAKYGGEAMEIPTEAYWQGYNDTDFNPIESVEDNDSIAKYGLLKGGLNNNEDIYPSIQHISLPEIELVNEIIAVERVVSDDVASAAENDANIQNINSEKNTVNLKPEEEKELVVSFEFTVLDGYKGTIFYSCVQSAIIYTFTKLDEQRNELVWGYTDDSKNIDFSKVSVTIKNSESGEVVSKPTNIPSGKYTFEARCNARNKRERDDFLSDVLGDSDATLSIESIKLSQSIFTEAGEEWKPTFDIWIKNIWQTKKLANETDQEYADRVWLPILGTDGQEASVVFSSGWLASSSDWDFMIVKGGYAYDESKSFNGIPSHWRLTLQKSDAEFKATNKYIPNMGMQAVAGDTFFFTGIDMPHLYVLFAEQRIDEWKLNTLYDTREINPTWVAKLDKVRIHNLEDGDEALLVDEINTGVQVHIADKRFIDVPYIDLYVQSVTYSYDDKIIPNVEFVLSDDVQVVKNPVAQIQSEISYLAGAMVSRTTIENMIRAIGDVLYLRKDGFEDISQSVTQFNSLVKSNNFRAGMIGGSGWGLYRDGNGNTIAEFDKIYARKEFHVNTFVVNQTTYVGGKEVISAASLECNKVIEVDNGYKCYFDKKNGLVTNLFQLDDVAYSQVYNPSNKTIRMYKRRVIESTSDYILLSKSDANGDIPSANDVIIHYGNYTNTDRQYVIVRDVIGGGYERMLSDLNSVNTDGVEYYFAGRINNGSPRWFVGNKNGEYAEWKDGKLTIKGKLEIGSEVGGATIVDGGLVTAETISLGSGGTIKAGVSGVGKNDSDIRFWAGADYKDRSNAPFRVNQKGQVVMTDANVTGTVNATNGVFKGSLALRFQELPQGEEVLLSFESGFNFSGVEVWNGNGNPYKTLILPSFDNSYNGVKCTIINNGLGYTIDGENAYPYKYFKVKTQGNRPFLHNSTDWHYQDSNIHEVWIEAGRLVTFTATILNGVVRWVIENEDGLKPIQENENILRGNGMPQPYVFWAGEIDTQKNAYGRFQKQYPFMGYGDDINVEMDIYTFNRFYVTFKTAMSDDWIYVPQITSMGATMFSIEDKSNSGFSIRMDGKIQLTILMLRSTIIT